MINLAYIAIPIFALLIGLEAYVSRRRGIANYETKDAFTNIFVGFASVFFGALLGLGIGVIYFTVYQLAPYKFPADAWWSWVILFFLDDLAYYWFHRISHEVRLFWNFHVVHHSSDRYNLSVAVRQSWFSGVLHWIFYAPIMLLGFAPWMFAIMHGINLLHQFWIHTELVRSLGPLEKIINSPSHHRVHHAVNDEYLDKNYGGVLVIWDRIFGSFAPEKELPRYGLIEPLESHNPLWINCHGWAETVAAVRNTRGIRDKIRCIFGSPYFAAEKAAVSHTRQ